MCIENIQKISQTTVFLSTELFSRNIARTHSFVYYLIYTREFCPLWSPSSPMNNSSGTHKQHIVKQGNTLFL